MTKKAVEFALLFLGLTILSCAQQLSSKEPVKAIVGKWRFVSSSGGFSGKGVDWKASDKILAEYKKNGNYKLTSSGKLKKQDHFSISKGRGIRSGEQTELLHFKNSIEQEFHIKGDTLFLDENVHDGFSYIFIRK
jgi:hypothetical protein